ncbi:MAG: hypothetical protein Q9220_004229 [cf. Caloplaca sp. 1 TL-2023]
MFFSSSQQSDLLAHAPKQSPADSKQALRDSVARLYGGISFDLQPMARLNEPAAPAESIEALKRRFIRQNRELARVNSAQSIKIRTLESEVSRLLSENISLREEVIKLQFEVDHHVGLESVTSVKKRLEQNLQELNGLVQELGDVQQTAEGRRGLQKRDVSTNSLKKSPDQRSWKNKPTISEVTAGLDGRLPPIVEGKYYPRRTLDAEELLSLSHNPSGSVDSPDLGPPPIAHFEASDPIKFDAGEAGNADEEFLQPSDDFNPALLANLETRRKRKGSSQPGEDQIIDLPGQQDERGGRPAAPYELEHTLKAGAKRRFSAREDGVEYSTAAPKRREQQDDENHGIPQSLSDDRAKLPRVLAETQSGRKMPEEISRIKDRPREKISTGTKLASSGRSILAPKSVNTDPVSSPVKSSRPAEGKTDESVIRDLDQKPRERVRTRGQAPSQRFARPAKPPHANVQEPKAATEIVLAPPPPTRPPPETPVLALEDAFPPEGSEPPVARPESRDTPPPADLDPETANTNAFGSLGRASRRQRGNVSYVQPNLRDKMRRPTKELVDAVGAEEPLKQRKGVKDEPESEEAHPLVTGEGPSKMRTVVVKEEPTGDDDWKALPIRGRASDQVGLRVETPSPLGNKVAVEKRALPASVATERRRRPSVLDRKDLSNTTSTHDSGAGSAIAALMTENSTGKSRDHAMETEDQIKAPRLTHTRNTFEVQDSFPATRARDTSGGNESKPKASKASRRHSNVSDDRMKEAMARRAERRKDMNNEERISSKVGGAYDLKNAKSAMALVVESRDEAQGRGERAANRRRSMML